MTMSDLPTPFAAALVAIAKRLPAGTHATILTGRDVVSGEILAYPVVWADRPYDTCPLCGQDIGAVVELCPVLLNTGAGQGGQIEERSQQHGCGEWLAVAWQQLPDDAGAEAILAAAHELKGAPTVRTFTVEIQASGDDPQIWQAVYPAESITAEGDNAVYDTEGGAAELARDVYNNQNVADTTLGTVRVAVWEGTDDTGLQPTAVYAGLETS